jgi:branched-chain amino acid transport system ATP-binding protein
VLKVIKIETSYGNIKALKGVSIEVGPGEAVALIGSNGAGKTTLLNTISGLMQARSGSILMEDKEITNLPSYKIVRKGISQVPEGRQVFSGFTVLENLRLGAYVVGKGSTYKENLDKAFSYFPILKTRSAQLAGTLSGGEQQMLALARGLMSSPRIMLLDEPSLGLAPLIVEQIFRIIEGLNQEGITFLLVEQNAFAALKICHRAYVLQAGEVVLEGDSRSLLSNDEVKKKYMGE